MRNKTLSKSIFTAGAAIALSFAASAGSHINYVNPIIGTNGMGHTFPGACAPFGAVQLSPDTENIPHNINGRYQAHAYDYCAGYQHADSTIVGFSHTHLSGTGHSDLGDVMIMPTTGELHLTPSTADKHLEGYRSAYSHDSEVTRPGYYAVHLDDYGIDAEFTATQRTGVHRYTYQPGTDKSHIILDMDHGIYNYDGKSLWTYIRVESPTLVTGYRITNGWARTNYTYFAIEFSEPIVNYGYTDMEKPSYTGFWRKFDLEHNFPEIAGRKVVAYFDVDVPDTRRVELRVGLSGVSTEGALKNLRAEASGRSFDEIASGTTTDWERCLSTIDAQGTDDQLAMFYTSLYHTMINPSVYMDVDGQYRGLDHNIHQADNFTNYTVFSLWDTFRAEHPLMNLLFPDRSTDMVKSLLAHQQQSVHKMLPVWSHMGNENWCMIGYHGVSVVGDALTKGAAIDGKSAFKAMDETANCPRYEGMKDYLSLGYVPFDHNGSAVSVTLEYAYDDWCLYQQAKRLGNRAKTREYRKRALNYRNVFDPSIAFSRPRYSDGSWKDPYSITHCANEGYLEGNAMNYAFFVPHDVKGLIGQMGGDKKFIENLDRLFNTDLDPEAYAETEDVTAEGLIGSYNHGNEPCQNIPYMYAWSSQPWKTQYWVREVLNRMYRNNIDGLCGNDDCGQMSAWYVFSALGFYPVCPGTDQYVIGAPYMPYACIQLPEGKKLEIKAPGVSDKNRYIKSVKLNGKPYDKAYLTHNDLMAGCTLEFEMSSKPNQKRCIATESKPYSLSDELAASKSRLTKYHEPIKIEKKWRDYNPGRINFSIESPETEGARIYKAIVADPDTYIADNARRVIQTLYFSPEDSIPNIRRIDYVVRKFDGISYKSGGGRRVRIDYSTDWVENSFDDNDTLKLDYETRGVIYHELTHAFQHCPQGAGEYDGKSPCWAFIEGTADAVRVACGCFDQDFASKDRPRGGNWMSGYRQTGYFLYWLSLNKDKDFIRKFNRSAIEVNPWSWDEAMYHILGRDEKNSVANLWEEYMAAIGDEKDRAKAKPVE